MKLRQSKIINKSEKLGNIIKKITGGRRVPKGTELKNEKTNYPYIRVTDLENKKVNLNNLKYLSEEMFMEIKNYRVELEDLILSNVGTIGRTSIVNKEISGLNLTENCLRIVVNEKIINNKYLEYYLNSIKGKKELDLNTIKTTIPKLSVKNAKKINVFFPEIENQNKIVTLLSDKESQIEKIKTLIAKLEKKNEYYAEKLLSGELRVREKEDGSVEFYENTEWKEERVNGRVKRVPVDWSIKKIGEISDIETGKKNANAGSDDGVYPFFTCSKENKKINSHSFDQEAILIAGNGVVGLSKYYNGKFDAYQRTYVLGNFKISGKYIFSYINKYFQKSIENEVVGGVISYIKLGNIANYKINIPNNEEIDIILKILNNLNSEKEKMESILKKETKEFEWLSEKLLSGEYIIED